MWEKILSNAWPYCSPYFLTYNICKGPNLLKMEIKVAGWDRCIFKKRLGETIKPAGKGPKGAISLFKSWLNKMFQVKKAGQSFGSAAFGPKKRIGTSNDILTFKCQIICIWKEIVGKLKWCHLIFLILM